MGRQPLAAACRKNLVMAMEDHFAGNSTRWTHTLEAAETEDDVVRAVRDYLNEWSERDVQQLPPSCRPRRIADGQHVAHWAFALASSKCARSRSDDELALLEKMTAFFAHASYRLAMLASPHHLVARRYYERLIAMRGASGPHR
jgi:hypothetical protein